MREEAYSDVFVDDDSDFEVPGEKGDLGSTSKAADLRSDDPIQLSPRRSPARKPARSDALAELYLHEIMALASCFLFPVMGACLLHAIRVQLSRPSEGLVSNYNLTIFLLASELKPLSHLMRLVQARTLHLQRIVNNNPHQAGVATPSQVTALAKRLEALEARSSLEPPTESPNEVPEPSRTKQEALLAQDVRNTIQPELDALNRAVRRYEKKATLLALQTESRFGAVNTRLDDAIALAAVAAKNSVPKPSVIRWVAESIVRLVALPFRSLGALFMLPFRALLGLVSRKKRAPEKTTRTNRSHKSPTQGRQTNDRQSSRLTRK